MSGKANLEVRPRFVNKGEIAKRLIAEYSEEAEELSEPEEDSATIPTGRKLEPTPTGMSSGPPSIPEPALPAAVANKLHVSSGPDFVLCLGDDFTDEDMFRALNASDLPKEKVFSVTVGASSKITAASWHLLEPQDVISALGLLNGTADDANVGAVAMLDGTDAIDGHRL